MTDRDLLDTDDDRPELAIPEVRGPCATCIRAVGAAPEGAQHLRVYCEHNRSGGLYSVEAGFWHALAPLTAEEFWRLVHDERA